ncbi:hypothetical protein HDU78_009354 [Chytriomyces hyalinus]|nr:hypothetical protein HDU78_009354 [Chytriomyces hyalinus]
MTSSKGMTRLRTKNLTLVSIALFVLLFTWFQSGSVFELDSRLLANTHTALPHADFPRVIHQSWKTRTIPRHFEAWSATWTALNPTYTHQIWSDEDNRNLVAEHYPWFLKTFDAFESNILRADTARLFYMHRFGGVYADLDFECLKSLDSLLDPHQAVLGSMSTGHNVLLRAHSIPNAFMASKPGHPFWILCARRIMRTTILDPYIYSTEQRTGPPVMFRCYNEYVDEVRRNPNSLLSQFPVYLAPREFVFPFSWADSFTKEVEQACLAMRSKSLNRTRCLDLVDPQRKAHAITYWGHSWTDPY